MLVEFEFSIGQIVYAKSSNHTDHLVPRKFCVIERIAQECSGGVQVLYKLDDANMWSEVALTAECPPFHDPGQEGRLAARREFADIERESWRLRREFLKDES